MKCMFTLLALVWAGSSMAADWQVTQSDSISAYVIFADQPNDRLPLAEQALILERRLYGRARGDAPQVFVDRGPGCKIELHPSRPAQHGE